MKTAINNRASISRGIFYLMGFCLPGCVIVALNTPAVLAGKSPPAQFIFAIYAFVGVPLLTAWGTAAVRHRLVRHSFTRAQTNPLAMLGRGLAAGVVVMGIVGVITVLTSVNVRLDLLMVALTVPCVWLSLIERSAKYVGFLCRACQYDLRGSLAAGRCPECGMAFDLPAPASVPMATPVGEAACSGVLKSLHKGNPMSV